MVAVDLNKKSKAKEANDGKKEKGTIDLVFSNYSINTKIDEKEFVE